MIALLDNGQCLDTCSQELGMPVGQLLTPLTRYRMRDPSLPCAIDNGFFADPNVEALLSLMRREEHRRDIFLFVTAPDIVGSAQRTLELFAHFKPLFAGWKVALVCQDGQEMLPIPWDGIDAVFIGGSTNWKCSHHVEQIIKTAKILGKHVHAGRVNTPERWKWFEDQGADTGDGSGMSRYSHMRRAIAQRGRQATLSLPDPVQHA